VALDSRDKRSSAVHVASPWRTTLPLAAGSVNADDRAHVGGYLARAADTLVTSRLMLEDGFLLFQEDGASYILLEQQVGGGAVVARTANLIRSPLIRSMRLSGLARH